MTLLQKILILYCEVRWGLFCFWASCREKFLGQLSSSRIRFAYERILARKLLRKVPWWARGHLLLGKSEQKLQEYVNGERSPEATAVICASSKAVQKLFEENLIWPHSKKHDFQREARLLL